MSGLLDVLLGVGTDGAEVGGCSNRIRPSQGCSTAQQRALGQSPALPWPQELPPGLCLPLAEGHLCPSRLEAKALVSPSLITLSLKAAFRSQLATLSSEMQPASQSTLPWQQGQAAAPLLMLKAVTFPSQPQGRPELASLLPCWGWREEVDAPHSASASSPFLPFTRALAHGCNPGCMQPFQGWALTAEAAAVAQGNHFPPPP
ncbi:glioma tumor suppressor candidate region protein 2 [Platysternon megacephalum]|uniref:Glioma tumor suppressor candidate region protein 2 n=1 Tax=Platysternon megacephalum TaxID=55544 RepID=A0A4D9E0Y8_9SAUR|nr:glioma tumor suppressor candidate region protein 2 [Platysternon megacephalum]